MCILTALSEFYVNQTRSNSPHFCYSKHSYQQMQRKIRNITFDRTSIWIFSNIINFVTQIFFFFIIIIIIII